MKHYTDNKLTWQAHSVMVVNMECIKTKRFPTGTKLTAQDEAECKRQVSAAKHLLVAYGCIDNQLKLEF